jgi:hypothetical protein
MDKCPLEYIEKALKYGGVIEYSKGGPIALKTRQENLAASVRERPDFKAVQTKTYKNLAFYVDWVMDGKNYNYGFLDQDACWSEDSGELDD